MKCGWKGRTTGQNGAVLLARWERRGGEIERHGVGAGRCCGREDKAGHTVPFQRT